MDESGTHGSSPSFVLGGVAVHEDDAADLQRELDDLVIKHLERVPSNLEEYELHASELRNAKKPEGSKLQRTSVWAAVPRTVRLALLDDAYRLLSRFDPRHRDLRVVLFGVAMDRAFRRDRSTLEREQFAYEILLNKFDMLLKEVRERRGLPNRGLVIHDRRVLAEADIQAWTSSWRATAGDVGQLRNLADVPLFSDSRASRLLQAADLVAYAVYRRYDPAVKDHGYFDCIWPLFHRREGILHGCFHYTPRFGQRSCTCESCGQRLLADSLEE